MKFSLLLALALTTLSVQASWFGSDPPGLVFLVVSEQSINPLLSDYTNWDSKQLQQWLADHDIKVPKSYSQDQLQQLVKANWHSSRAWTQDQYTRAQQSFQNIRDSTFDAWDESRLREWLLGQGIVAPSGPREQLLLLAKQRYKSYTDAASSFTNSVTSVMSDTSQTAEHYVTMATDEVGRKLEDTKDYVYSSWDESQLKDWLVSKGAIKSDQQKSRDEMLKLMHKYYAKVADPTWSAWSDSYMVMPFLIFVFLSLLLTMWYITA
jgi:Putative nuclear envelope organisation protein